MAEEDDDEVVRWRQNNNARQAPLRVAGCTPLHVASAHGHLGVVELLLGQPELILSPANEAGDTPLHLAASHGHKPVVAALVRHGADVEAKNSKGHGPTTAALLGGHDDAADVIIAKAIAMRFKEKKQDEVGSGHHDQERERNRRRQ